MDAFETRLSEQIRLYKHLYDRSMREYRDSLMTSKSWREIAAALGREEAFCRRVWKNTRDRFVKAKRTQRMKRGAGTGVYKKVPPILLELEWLSQYVKHKDMDNSIDPEDDGAGLDNEVQEIPLNYCTLDATRIDPPISSVTPGTLSPPCSEPSSSLAEITSSGGSSPSARDSPSPLNLFTAAAQSTHPGLLSPVAHHVNRPKPSTSPCTTDAERRTADCVLCVVHQDQERQKPAQQENADSRFCEVIRDMLANVNPAHKADVKFKIYQLLFEAERDFPIES